jgi:hypothetical protein
MASQDTTIGTRAARALSNLDHLVRVVRQSVGSARLEASIARVGRLRWKLPTAGSFLKDDQFIKNTPAEPRRFNVDGSQSGPGNRSLRNETDNRPEYAQSGSWAGGRHRATETIATRGGLSAEVRQLSRAMNALSRIRRSVESGNAARAMSSASRRATLMAVDKTISMNRARENPEAKRAALSRTGFEVSARIASTIRAVTPPSNVTPREFSELSGSAGGASNSGGRSGITINSSPTVVIHAAAAGGDLQRDVIDALRAHREELFDQLKRESARRERSQF